MYLSWRVLMVSGTKSGIVPRRSSPQRSEVIGASLKRGVALNVAVAERLLVLLRTSAEVAQFIWATRVAFISQLD